MEGFSFVTPVTGLNRSNTGKEDDVDADYIYIYKHMKFLMICHTSRVQEFGSLSFTLLTFYCKYMQMKAQPS
jgi:hypothetical protein